MSSPYNLAGRTDNCGFCAIAHALHVQHGKEIKADDLYLETLNRLGLARERGRDPLPRLLIFPEPRLDSIPMSTAYKALAEHGHGLSSYTITSVAEASGLRFEAKIEDLGLSRQFMQWCSDKGHDWDFNEFVDWRLDFLQGHGGNPSREAVKRNIAKQLAGHSIVGSKVRQHYINLYIGTGKPGRIEAFDPQNGNTFDGRGFKLRLTSIDLLMHSL